MNARYREALEKLDRLNASGQLTSDQYELHKTRLLAEASRASGLSRPRKAVLLVAAVIFGVLLFLLASRISTML